MKKYVNVIKKNKKNLAITQPTIERVKKGYAFNYLIPNQLAELATQGKIKHLTMLNNLSKEKKNQLNQLSQQINNEITSINMIHIRKKCGNNHQIFGRVSEQEIKEKISNIIGESIDKKQIIVNSIKQIGTYTCHIKISEQITTKLQLRILPYHTM